MNSFTPLPKKPKLSTQIDELVLDPKLIQKLKEVELITFKSVIHLSQPELQKICKVSATEAKSILEITSKALLENKLFQASSFLSEKKLVKLKFSLDLLKSHNENCNGIYTGTITEICGESGCGKTQLCLHFSIHAQKPIPEGGLETRVIYIHSEGDFPIKRFLQMANTFKRKNPQLQHLMLLDNLILKKVQNLIEVMHVLQEGIPKLLQTTDNIKMIVIDSVAALLRCEYESLGERTMMVQKFAYEIWKLANIYGMAVICVNQVSGTNEYNSATGTTSCDIPSLGLLWSTALTTRMNISRKKIQSEPAIRVLEIIYSSYHPRTENDFIICESGIVAL